MPPTHTTYRVCQNSCNQVLIMERLLGFILLVAWPLQPPPPPHPLYSYAIECKLPCQLSC